MEKSKFEEGFRFRPTDSEGLTYLLKFVAGRDMRDCGFITTNVDVYGKQEPWEIYDSGVPCGDDEDNSSYRYFITKLKKKGDTRYYRSVGNKGTWRQEDKEEPVHYKNMKKTSSFVNMGSRTCFSYRNKKFYPEDQKDGHWLMKQYELSNVIHRRFDKDRRGYVLCAIKKLKLNRVSDGTDEVTSSADDLLAPNNCKGHYNMCKNLEHSETLAFQESMMMNNSVFEPLQVAAEPAGGTTFGVPELYAPDDLYQRDGHQLDKLNQMSDGVPEVDAAVEPLAAAEPEVTYICGQHSFEATARYDPSMANMSRNSAPIGYSEVDDVLGLDPWDIMDPDEFKRMLEDVSECCPDRR